MKTAEEICREFGIRPPRFADGRYYTTCPKCSASRSRAHQKSECLGITINAKGVHFGCSHCGWKGGGYYNGSGGERTNALNCYYSYGARLRKVRGPNKRFWWEHLDGGGRWTKGTDGQNTKILYRLDEVRRAIADDCEIAVVEGEKDVDNLWAIGIPATCNAHGAHDPTKKQKPKLYREHSEQLRGARIVVFNDNDQAGYEHAEAICKLSHGVAKRVRRLDLKEHWPEIPNSGDVSDWLAAGGTRARLDALMEQAPHWPPSHEPTIDPNIAGAGAVDAAFREFNASISAAKSKDDKLTAIRRCAKAIAPYGDNDDRLVVRLYEAIPDDVDIDDADKEIHIGFDLDETIEPNEHAGTAEKRKPQRKTKPRTNGHGDTGDAGGTREQLDALVERAPDWQPTAEPQANAQRDQGEPAGFDAIMEQISQKYALVLLGDKAAIIEETGDDYRLLTIGAFKQWFSNQTVTVSKTVMPVAAVWLNSKLRRQFKSIVFAPNRDVPDAYNLWRGFPIKPIKGDCSKFLAHIRDNVCRGDPALYAWVIAWMAVIFQNPGSKCGTSLALRGKMGSGKTIVGKYLRSLLGVHYWLVEHSDHVTGKFNAHHSRLLLLHCDEAFWAGDKQGLGRLRSMVTGDKQSIEFKGKDLIQIDSFIRLLVTGDDRWVVPAGLRERRFAVLDVGEGHLQDHDYFAAIEYEMNHGGSQALLHHLLREVDLSKVNLHQIPQTAALIEQKVASMDPLNGWWLDLLRKGELPGDRDGAGITPRELIFNSYIEHARRVGHSRKSIETVVGCFIKTIAPGVRLANEVVTVQTIDRLGNHFSHTYRGTYGFPPLAACRAEFAKQCGATDWDWEEGCPDAWQQAAPERTR